MADEHADPSNLDDEDPGLSPRTLTIAGVAMLAVMVIARVLPG